MAVVVLFIYFFFSSGSFFCGIILLLRCLHVRPRALIERVWLSCMLYVNIEVDVHVVLMLTDQDHRGTTLTKLFPSVVPASARQHCATAYFLVIIVLSFNPCSPPCYLLYYSVRRQTSTILWCEQFQVIELHVIEEVKNRTVIQCKLPAGLKKERMFFQLNLKMCQYYATTF